MRSLRSLSMTSLGLILSCGALHAGIPPAGFQETTYLSGISQIDGFEWAPNGDMWIISKLGTVRVLHAGTTVPVVVASLPVNTVDERGLLGIAIDPGFATNKFLYLYYT